MSATMRRDASGSGHRTDDASMSAIVTVSTSTRSTPMSVWPIDWVKLKISTPNVPRSLRATAPAATRVAVSRADDRSSTFRTSVWPYLSAPARSAWPGRSRVTGLGAKPSVDAVISAVQFAWSLFSSTKVTGLPMVNPPRTPLAMRAKSVSIFCRPPRPWPPWRRAEKHLNRDGDRGQGRGPDRQLAGPPGPPRGPANRDAPPACDVDPDLRSNAAAPGSSRAAGGHSRARPANGDRQQHVLARRGQLLG